MSQFGDNLREQVDHHNDANPYPSEGRLQLDNVIEQMRKAAEKKLKNK